MAYILKSNVSINDPNDLINYYTKYGVTTPSTKIYLDDLESDGFVLDDNEGSAIVSFVRNLDNAGVWPKVRECYPFIGDSLSAVSLKLKSVTANRRMAALGGLSFSDFELVNGKSVGKNITTWASVDSKRFNTGLKISDLDDSWAIHAYLGSIPIEASTNNLPLWGASQNEFATRSTVANFLNDGANAQEMRLSNQSDRIEHTTPSSMGPFVYQAVADKDDASIYLNGALDFSSVFPSRQPGALPTNRDLHLFGQNGFGTNENVTGHFPGKVRFFMLTDGNLTISEQDFIRNQTELLMSALGRAF